MGAYSGEYRERVGEESRGEGRGGEERRGEERRGEGRGEWRRDSCKGSDVLPQLQCAMRHNSNLSGDLEDYPLCSVELTADMYAVRDTPTCFRRAGKGVWSLG